MSCRKCGHHSSTSAHVDLSIDNNVTWQDAFQFGTPGDLTWSFAGQTFQLEVKRNSYDPAALLTLTTGAGTIVTDDNVQRVLHTQVPYTAVQAALANGSYVYDLIMIDGSSPAVRVALMHGSLSVGQGVSI